jgi:hypothetical protein
MAGTRGSRGQGGAAASSAGTAAGAVRPLPCAQCVGRMAKNGTAGLCRDGNGDGGGNCSACAAVHHSCDVLPERARGAARALVVALTDGSPVSTRGAPAAGAQLTFR